MSFELFECRQPKTIKTDLFYKEQEECINGLFLDAHSKLKYMEKLTHSKTQPK